MARCPSLHPDGGEMDLDDEVARLVALGARRVDWPHYPADPHPAEPPYVVLADPESNRFCVQGRGAGDG
ncbi:VOC family protein [Micromonospora sp. DSM 115977]|uniref:VOC family protein n=1 Tax=Micromonospora reichwaldensis TaxID=3075516 RepID=A0ABU2WTS9_9ACTN|nr:VOC family protein [Micromonospora sp. DSM 115977]MDT0529335.1 VOC family protein [Micromonospora sp. DSM 115977]